jgi:hypothetical protein
LFTGKIPEIPKAKERGRTLENDETFYSKYESKSTFYINRDHLKGHSRSLSYGAVTRVQTLMEDDEYLSPSKPTDSKPFNKSPSCRF